MGRSKSAVKRVKRDTLSSRHVQTYLLNSSSKALTIYRKFIQSPVGVLCILIILIFGYFKRIHPKIFTQPESLSSNQLQPVLAPVNSIAGAQQPAAAGSFGSIQLPSLGNPLVNAASAVGMRSLVASGCDFYPEIEQWDRGISSENYLKYYNNSQQPVHPNFVVFVGQQRTASKTLDALWKNLGQLNNFDTHFNVEIWNQNKTLDHKDKIVSYLKEKEATCPNAGKKILYSDRNVWVNFTNFKQPQPTFMTFIRNPIDQYASMYYKCRFGTNERPQYRTMDCKTLAEKKLKLSIPQCIDEYSKYESNCVDKFNPELLKWLCGTESECLAATPNTVEITKIKMLQNYYFIGIIEHMKESLQTLERLMPQFFKDAVRSYENLQIDFKRSSAKNKKPLSSIPDDKMVTLANVFKYEIDLFKFAEQWLFERMKAVGLPQPTPVPFPEI